MPCPASPGGYAAPPSIFVNTTSPNAGANSGASLVASLETAVQQYIAQETSYPRAFLLNPPPQDNLVAAGAAGAQAQILAFINVRCQAYPSICAGIDLNALAAKYANILVSTLKAIPACGFDASLTGSVYDNWGKGINPQNCPPGFTGTQSTGCVPLPCPSGFQNINGPGTPCIASPAAVGQSVTPGQTQQSAPSGSVPVQTTPTTYGGGTTIQTVAAAPGGGSTNAGTSQVATGPTQNGQTPFVAANLIPAATLATAMQSATGYPMAIPAAWCSLMAQMLGGFSCPAMNLPATTPVNASTFLAALRAVESAQTAAPAITTGGFLPGAPAGVTAPVPAQSGPTPALAPAFLSTISPTVIGIAVALVIVVLLVKKG